MPTTVLVDVLAKAVDAWLMRLARNESAPPRLLEKLRTLAYAQSFVERLGLRGLLGLGATAWARRMPFLVHEDKYRATATLLVRLMPVSVARMAEANTLEEGYPLGTPAFALTQGEWAAALGLIIARYHVRRFVLYRVTTYADSPGRAGPLPLGSLEGRWRSRLCAHVRSLLLD